MLFDRQKRLLAFLGVLERRVGRLDFQKLLFLYCQESQDAPGYEFVPYKFGAFSFTSYADLRKLADKGLVEEGEHCWALTEDGAKAADDFRRLCPTAVVFAAEHRLRGDALVAESYRQYPYYATRSLMADRVLRGDLEALLKVAASRPKAANASLMTIGYEGRTLENYLNTLLRMGVTLLCDVRRNPLSRKYGFSKRTLSHGCEGVGIRYEHLPSLGIDSSERRGLETQADYDNLFESYERDSLPLQSAALARIEEWIQAQERVALTCYELHPHQCHRHCVSEAVERRLGESVAAIHL